MLCRPNRALPNPPVYEYEDMGSGFGSKNMTKNPAYMTAGEAVTNFSSGTEADKGTEDHTYEVLPCEGKED